MMKTLQSAGLRPVRAIERAQLYSNALPDDAKKTNTLPIVDALRIIPFGGVEQVGINMTAYEYGDDIIVVDMGLGFPPSDMKGVNYIIPNYQWLEENRTRIRAIIITHGHLDHIGGIAYILPRLGNPPIYSMPLSIGFIKQRLSEFNLENHTQLIGVSPDDVLRLGNFTIEFFRVNHNIPDSMGLAISTPSGRVIHTGDWKLDFTPGDDRPAEMDKLARWGAEGSLALLSDSTNAKKPGYCTSEATLKITLERTFKDAPARILFSSNALILTRIQQVLDICAALNKKVAIVGRSMQNNIETALSLGYLKIAPKTIIPINKAKQYPDDQIVILTTGAQGEDNAGLYRMAHDDHRDVKIKAGDTVILSATPIPGNENAVDTLLAKLSQLGVIVIHHKILDIHISGHAQQEELKMMINLVKPKYIIPIHGEYHMLTAHKNLAVSIGMPEQNVFLPFNGSVFEFDKQQGVKTYEERLEASPVFVDETAIGYVDPMLFCDKEEMASAGVVSAIITVDRKGKKLATSPELVTRGFTYNNTSGSLISELRYEAQKLAENMVKKDVSKEKMEAELKELLSGYILQKTHRHPLILPIIVEV